MSRRIDMRNTGNFGNQYAEPQYGSESSSDFTLDFRDPHGSPTGRKVIRLLGKKFIYHMVFVIIFTAIYSVLFNINPQGWGLDTNPNNKTGMMSKIGTAFYYSAIVQTTLGFGGVIPREVNTLGKVIVALQSIISLYINLVI